VSGWIKLHRDLVKHWIYSFDEPDKALAWIDLIMLARHDDGEILLKGRVQRVSRGQVAMSQLALQKRWRWSQNKVKRFLKLLKNERMVDFQTDYLTTLITICKYEEYQERERPDGRALGRPDGRPVERATDDQTNDDIRIKEGKEGKKGKNKPPLPPKGKQFELPSSVDSTVWAEFEQHRREIRKPLTAMARTKAANILKPLSIADQKATVDKSIQSRWTGLFPEKVNGHEAHKRTNKGIDHTDTSWAETYNREYGRGSS